VSYVLKYALASLSLSLSRHMFVRASPACITTVTSKERERKRKRKRKRGKRETVHPKLRGILPQDEFYFTTSKKKTVEKCRCIVPNFIND
jgi:hypothetical protein